MSTSQIPIWNLPSTQPLGNSHSGVLSLFAPDAKMISAGLQPMGFQRFWTLFFFCKNTPSMFSYPQFSGPEVESVCRSLHFKPQIKPDVHVAGSQASRSEQKAARPSPFPFPQLTPFPRCPQVARFSNASQHLKILCRDATVLKTHRSETFTRPAEQHLASATAMGHKMWDWKNAKGSENF